MLQLVSIYEVNNIGIEAFRYYVIYFDNCFRQHLVKGYRSCAFLVNCKPENVCEVGLEFGIP